MRNSLFFLPSLANEYFNSLRDENDEPIYTHNPEYMRYFVRQSTKGGICGSFNQCCKSNISSEAFNNISKEIDINGNICEILDIHFEFLKKHRKTIENNFDSRFQDYRVINENENSKYFNDKLGNLTIHEKLQ